MLYDLGSLYMLVLAYFLDALFTGLMLVAVIAFAFRFLRVRGVTFRVDAENRDQDRGD